MRIRLLALAALLLISAAVVTARQNGNDLYQQGLARETAGDIKGAIQIFERIVRDFSSNRPLTAKALVQLGRWSDLLGEDQARKHYERVIRDYADQKDAAAEARARLDALSRPASGASPARRLVVDSKGIGGLRASLTRDGRHLISYNTEQRAFDLYEISSGQVRRLASGGPNPEEASIIRSWTIELSSDGRRLAAIVRFRKPGSPAPGMPLQSAGRTELQVFDVGGRGPGRVLANWDEQTLRGGFWPFAWAPRNDRIWLIGGFADRSQIASVTVNVPGKLEVLKTLPWGDYVQPPSLSPDGRFLAYHARPDRRSPADLYILATDGSREHHVEHPADDSKPMFLPDGAGIVFESNRRGGDRDLWFLPVTDGRPSGEPRLVSRDVGSIASMNAFSDTGSLFFTSYEEEYGTYTVPLDLDATAGAIGEPRRVPELNNESNSGAAYSPDGRYLAHFRGSGARLVLRELASGLEREFPFGARLGLRHSTADWCPDGDSLIATGFIHGTAVGFRVNVSDASIERLPSIPLTGYDVPVLCVGDGQEIIYLRTSGNYPWVYPGSLVRRSLTTGREATLYTGAAAPLARSRDGKRLAFVAVDPNGTLLARRLVTMAAEGGDISAGLMPSYPTAHAIQNAVWMPDGNRLLIGVREGDESKGVPELLQAPFSLWEVPLTGAQPRKLGVLPLPKVDGTFFGTGSFSVHPDAKQLAFPLHEGSLEQTWAIDNLVQFIKAGSK